MARFKRVQQAQNYTIAEFATVATTDGVFEGMSLANISWKRQQNLPQEVSISLTFESVNVAGSIAAPGMSLSGLVT